MEAQSFTHEVEAKTAAIAFDKLKQKALYEHGYCTYNGTISTCDLGKCMKTFDKPSAENIAAAYEFIENDDYGKKWVAQYIDLGVKRKGAVKHTFIFYGWASC